MPHFDPRDLAKMPADMRDKQIAEWTKDAKDHWTVENEELVNDGHGAYLTTDEEFTDYEFLIDYKTVALADSGIYLKANPQVQIWDYTEEAKFSIGAAACGTIVRERLGKILLSWLTKRSVNGTVSRFARLVLAPAYG
jgi:hypothetical protein